MYQTLWTITALLQGDLSFLYLIIECMVHMCVMYFKMLGRDDKLPGFAVIQMHRS